MWNHYWPYELLQAPGTAQLPSGWGGWVFLLHSYSEISPVLNHPQIDHVQILFIYITQVL